MTKRESWPTDVDKPVRLSEVARLLERTYNAVLLWAQHGSIGVDGQRHRLVCLKIGGVWHTTLGAYRRFIAAQNMPPDEEE